MRAREVLLMLTLIVGLAVFVSCMLLIASLLR